MAHTADEPVEVLVHPAGDARALVEELRARRERGELEFNVLELAGVIALRAPGHVVDELAARDDVARNTVNPRFEAGNGP